MVEMSEQIVSPQVRVPCYHASDFQIRLSERECTILFCRSAFSLDPNAPRQIEPVFALSLSPQLANELSAVVKSTFDQLNAKTELSLASAHQKIERPDISKGGAGRIDCVEQDGKTHLTLRDSKGSVPTEEMGGPLMPNHTLPSVREANATS